MAQHYRNKKKRKEEKRRGKPFVETGLGTGLAEQQPVVPAAESLKAEGSCDLSTWSFVSLPPSVAVSSIHGSLKPLVLEATASQQSSLV